MIETKTANTNCATCPMCIFSYRGKDRYSSYPVKYYYDYYLTFRHTNIRFKVFVVTILRYNEIVSNSRWMFKRFEIGIQEEKVRGF